MLAGSKFTPTLGGPVSRAGRAAPARSPGRSRDPASMPSRAEDVGHLAQALGQLREGRVGLVVRQEARVERHQPHPEPLRRSGRWPRCWPGSPPTSRPARCRRSRGWFPSSCSPRRRSGTCRTRSRCRRPANRSCVLPQTAGDSRSGSSRQLHAIDTGGLDGGDQLLGTGGLQRPAADGEACGKGMCVHDRDYASEARELNGRGALSVSHRR